VGLTDSATARYFEHKDKTVFTEFCRGLFFVKSKDTCELNVHCCILTEFLEAHFVMFYKMINEIRMISIMPHLLSL
jgi:hypothetical protein